jgi:hypothetical protein
MVITFLAREGIGSRAKFQLSGILILPVIVAIDEAAIARYVI